MIAVSAISVFIIKVLSTKRQNSPYNTVKHKDILKLSDIVEYFKSLYLDPEEDTPFICKDLSKLNINITPSNPSDHLLLIGTYKGNTNNILDYVLVSCRQYDKNLEEVLEKAVNGIVVLS
jgi:hypothetical protein